MANTTLTPNMSLIVPTVGVDPGPDYAINVNNDLSILDGHDHSPGYGVQITPAGLNINSDLPMSDNNIINLRTARFIPQPSTPSGTLDIGCLYEFGVDLYYNDGSGNVIQITRAGGVAGTPGSIGNLTAPASATYVPGSSTFVWQSAAGVAANMDFGSAILRNLSPNSTFGLTLSPPASLSQNYTLTLPHLPASANTFLTIDPSGIINSVVNVDNSTLVITSNTLKVNNQGITSTQIANATITSTQIASGTILGSNIAGGTITGGNIASSTVATTNLTGLEHAISSFASMGATSGEIVIGTVTLATVSGFFTKIELVSGLSSALFCSGSGPNFVNFYKDGSLTLQAQMNPATLMPPSSYSFIDVGTSGGTHTYEVRMISNGGAAQYTSVAVYAYVQR